MSNYELRHGPIDRKEFEGEFVVPQEIRNRSAKGSLRIHGGLLTLSRSRTFLSLSNGNRSFIHSSTPDLSRSVPNTPGSSHKVSLTSSYDSVLEENDYEGVIDIKKEKKTKEKHVQHVFIENENKNINKTQCRRNSEDLLETRDSSKKPTMIAVNADQTFKLIPRVKHFVNIAETSESTTALNSCKDTTHWGRIRGSNSFAAVTNISSLSTYTIPRVSLSHHNKLNETAASTLSSKSLTDSRVASTFVVRHDNDDSTA